MSSPDRYHLDPGARAFMVDLGVRPAAVLRRAGLRADLLASSSVWLSQDDFFALWEALEHETGDPELPLRLGDAFAPEAFAPPIFAAMMSRDLLTAASRISTYKRLMGPMRLVVSSTADELEIAVLWPDGATPPPLLVLTELLFWVQLARTGTRRRVEPRRVDVPFAPPSSPAYRSDLGVDVTAGDRPRVVFDAADATAPFLIANEAVWRTFEPDLRRRLDELEADAATADRVRAALLELLPTGRNATADVAAELAMSPRTLHRRLHAESTTFQRILDQTREDLARHYLRDGSLGAPEIAFLLGFEETSSFYRAFQNWTGETPEQVRTASVSN